MPVYSPSVACTEMYGTREENADNGSGLSATVQLLCTAANKDALLADLLVNQREYPNFATTIKPRAVSASAVPLYTEQASVDQGFVFDEYLVTVNYSSRPEKQLLSETIEPSAEFTLLDHRLFRWKSDGAPLTEGESPGFLQIQLKLKRQIYGASLVPTALLSPGRVHNAAYVSSLLGLTFPSGTLLLLPENISRTITTGGTAGFDYGIAFSYKPNGWNKYWRPQTQTWDTITTAAGTDYYSYPEADLSALLA